eukprot:TRINITY_DN42005_c0_g1_i1.p1 TRINITY_DN42005_c0_g1~~TRINITY_DN42005_c0_g1_i1.p1  ORF type:complete len:230 (-),score=44.22 TRINITY_DN42005_c0_g1_i1:132-821(-)
MWRTGMSSEEFNALAKRMDRDGDGTIDVNELRQTYDELRKDELANADADRRLQLAAEEFLTVTESQLCETLSTKWKAALGFVPSASTVVTMLHDLLQQALQDDPTKKGLLTVADFKPAQYALPQNEASFTIRFPYYRPLSVEVKARPTTPATDAPARGQYWSFVSIEPSSCRLLWWTHEQVAGKEPSSPQQPVPEGLPTSALARWNVFLSQDHTALELDYKKRLKAKKK